VIILDPAGRENTIPVKLKKEPNGVFVCEYTPAVQGVHSVKVFYANQPVPLSPFAVGVTNGNDVTDRLFRDRRKLNVLFLFCYRTASDPKRVKAFGRGLQPHGVRVQDEAKFKIVTDGAGEGVPEVNIIGPGNSTVI